MLSVCHFSQSRRLPLTMCMMIVIQMVKCVGLVSISGFRTARNLIEAAEDTMKGALHESGEWTGTMCLTEPHCGTEHRDDAASECPMPALSEDLTRTTSPARARFTQGVAEMLARTTADLTAIGIENADREATALQAQLVGAVSLARAVDSPSLSHSILSDTLAQIVARFGLAKQ